MLEAYRQLRARRALVMFKDAPLRTRRALSLYKVYGDSALLVLSGTSLNSVNALLALSRRYILWALLEPLILCVCSTACDLLIKEKRKAKISDHFKMVSFFKRDFAFN